MSDLLLAALERLPRRVRRFVVAVGALLALSVVMAALTLTTPHGGQERRRVPQHPAATVPRTPRRRLPLPVSTAALVQARLVAERFLAGYLPLAYGRGSPSAVSGVTLALRRQLLRQGAQLTPAERRRRPRAVSLQTVGTTLVFVVATAAIDDGGVATYRLRFTLQGGGGRWAVSGVEAG
jgi:hypothetical protein